MDHPPRQTASPQIDPPASAVAARAAHGDAAVAGAEPRVNRRPLAIALAITTTFLVVEVIGAYLTNSLALLADALHMLTDVAAIALALFAIWLASRPARPARTYGNLRAEILAALANAVSLLVISLYIFWEAWRRLQEPPEVKSGLMLVVGVAGLAANAVAAWVLSRGGGHRENLNTRGAFLHVIGDLLGSVAAIAAAVIIALTGWNAADPILSAVIGGLVVFSAFSLLRETVNVLLEAAPAGMDITRVRDAILTTPNVAGVHDLHVWTVTSGFVALSAHVDISDARSWAQTSEAIAATAREQFGIAHVTLQPEAPGEPGFPTSRCSIDDADGRAACLAAATPAAVGT